MIYDEERLGFETERFIWLCNPFGSQDVREAIRFGIDFGFNADKIFDIVEQFSKETGIPFDELDIVYIVYEHVLHEAKERFIAELAGLDRDEREELLDDFLLRFLEYIGITQADIEQKAEGLREEEILVRE